MCEVSDKLQLCTCAEVDFDSAKHYWIYHRFVKGKKNFVVGQPMLPCFIDEKTDLANRDLLTRLLNENSVFDKPIQPAERDLLELSFLVGEVNKCRLTYGFKYYRGQWVEEEYDSLVWMWRHEEAKHGKIKNAIKNKNE